MQPPLWERRNRGRAGFAGWDPAAGLWDHPLSLGS